MRKILFISFLVILFSFNLNAQIDKGTTFLGSHFSVIQLVGGEENSQVKCWWGINGGHYFSKRLGFEFNASMGWTRPPDDLYGTRFITYLYPVTTNLRFNFATDKKLIPYGLLGVGMLYWDVRYVTNDTDDHMFWERRGNTINGAMQRDAIINAGIGLNYFFTNSFGLDASARYHMLLEHEDDLSGYNDQQSAILEFRLGIAYFFGAKKDGDKDGIKDKYDLCPSTPKGVKVDSDGCAVDSDKDGIANYKDKCANTPKAAKVDESGCPKDSDKDGVADYKDKCANTPKSVKVDAKGCPLDSDKDSIPDYRDKCPQTKIGVRVDKNGCKIVEKPTDSDKDGIPDSKDKCPNTPRNVKIDKFGCEIIKFEAEKPIILDGVTFASGKSVLTPKAKTTLMKVLITLKNYSKMKISINGYTDNTGSFDYNVNLSKKRAEAVKNFFVNSGIQANRLTAKGFGPKDPIAPNNTKEGRAKNRRIEFIRIK